jgi:phosphopantothenoylcysteine decarboxylase/phosphopantothenate--cysteine ligase
MLARLFAQAGAEVDVVMTRAALEFVGAITFEAVTGRRVYSEIFGAGNALDHIRLAREASLFVVAPATADFMARVAHGHADDLLTACLLANVAPVLLVPAMNDRMWANAQTARNAAHLRELGYTVLDPDEGPLAAGEGSGPGRMPEPEAIFSHAARIVGRQEALAGKHIVVTAGATREPIDPVRFISNHSSGRMGAALAEAAWLRGARVTLIAGHMDVPVHAPVARIDVNTVAEMKDAVATALGQADALIMAAAPADFSPASPSAQKMKKAAGTDAPAIALSRAPDILQETIGNRKPGCVVVGFALETENLLTNAKAKLAQKKLDLIVANSASEKGAGFGGDTNRVTILSDRAEPEELPLMLKSEVAGEILDRIQGLMNGS